MLRGLAQGKTHKTIAKELEVEVATVDTHAKHLREKFKASGVVELLNKARRHGFPEVQE